MSANALTVEERIRSSLVICQTLQQCALLANEAPSIVVAGFTAQEVLRNVIDGLDTVRDGLIAVKIALPADSMALSAPLQDGAR